jgi:hypothetical protein
MTTTFSLSEIRDRAVNTFKEWLDRHKQLFFTDVDEKKHKTKQRQLKQLLKSVTDVENSTSIPDLLGFALWAQNMLTMWGVNFGMGIVGEPLKSFYLANDVVDEECSRGLAHALADMLQLQFIYPHPP